MAEPTKAFATRIEQIIARNPAPRPDSGADDDARIWLNRASDRCDSLFPRRYLRATPDHPEIAEWVDAYRSDPETAPSLLILGPTGVGKTWLAYGALRAAVTQPRAIRWHALTSADLYASLRPRQGVDTEALLADYTRSDLLLIDDLGAAKATDWVEEVTYRLLNGRYGDMRPTIFTSNVPTDALVAVLGDRIASRLAEVCLVVVLAGSDRRRVA